MTLESVTEHDKRNIAKLKKSMMMPCQHHCNTLSFFQFMTNLKQSQSWIPEAWSLKLTYPLILFFYLTKIENKT